MEYETVPVVGDKIGTKLVGLDLTKNACPSVKKAYVDAITAHHEFDNIYNKHYTFHE